MTRTFGGTLASRLGLALALIVTVGWILADPACAGAQGVSDRLKRQINVMEKIIDEILVDSPNLLVGSSSPSNGFYLDEFGAVFSFEASLVSSPFRLFDKDFDFLDIRVESGDNKVIIWRDANADEDEDDEDDDEGEIDIEKWKEKEEARKIKRAEKEKELYAAGKEELIVALADYGETLSGLGDNEWIAIAVFLGKNHIFKKESISRLVIRAQMSDLRAEASGRLTRDALLNRMVVDEY
jgi:hypothetical protein